METGQIIQGYQMVRILGRGGFGEVWEALHLDHQQPVAIKFLHLDLHASNEDDSLVERFRAEARVLTRLKHPGIVHVLDVLDDGERPILAYVMELLHGNPLEKIRNNINIYHLVNIFRQVASALSYLHKKNIIHRDVKCGNIFVCDRPMESRNHPVRLLDFGISKLPGLQVRTKPERLLGTLNMMAPECFDAVFGAEKVLTPAVDQWSFGIALFRMLTGRSAFRGTNLPELMQAIRGHEPPEYPLIDRFKGSPQAARLLEVLGPCLHKDPRDRYPRMEIIAGLLKEIEDDLRPRSSDGLTSLQSREQTLPPSREAVEPIVDTQIDTSPLPAVPILQTDSLTITRTQGSNPNESLFDSSILGDVPHSSELNMEMTHTDQIPKASTSDCDTIIIPRPVPEPSENSMNDAVTVDEKKGPINALKKISAVPAKARFPMFLSKDWTSVSRLELEIDNNAPERPPVVSSPVLVISSTGLSTDTPRRFIWSRILLVAMLVSVGLVCLAASL